jgi:hypothetical protein
MVGLLNIAPMRRKVPIKTETENGDPLTVNIPVPGISAYGISTLMQKFPEVRKLLADRKLDDEDLSADNVMKLAPKVVAAVIACGLGYPDDEEHEKWASQFGASDQLDFIEAILDVTFKDGLGPFVEKLSSIGLRAQAMPANPASVDGGKDQATKSPSHLNGSSVSEVIPQT